MLLGDGGSLARYYIPQNWAFSRYFLLGEWVAVLRTNDVLDVR